MEEKADVAKALAAIPAQELQGPCSLVSLVQRETIMALQPRFSRQKPQPEKNPGLSRTA